MATWPNNWRMSIISSPTEPATASHGAASSSAWRRHERAAIIGQFERLAPALGLRRRGSGPRPRAAAAPDTPSRTRPPYPATAGFDLLDDLVAVTRLLGEQRERGRANVAPLRPRPAVPTWVCEREPGNGGQPGPPRQPPMCAAAEAERPAATWRRPTGSRRAQRTGPSPATSPRLVLLLASGASPAGAAVPCIFVTHRHTS